MQGGKAILCLLLENGRWKNIDSLLSCFLQAWFSQKYKAGNINIHLYRVLKCENEVVWMRVAPQGSIYSKAWSSVSGPVWKEFGCEALLEKRCHYGSVGRFKSLCNIQCFTTVCASGSVGNSQLLCQHHASLPAAMLPAILVVEANLLEQWALKSNICFFLFNELLSYSVSSQQWKSK